MKNLHKLSILILLLFLGQKSMAQDFPDLHFGTEETLDIISWNIEWFPKNGQTTIANVKNIIIALDAEVIAIQELDIKSSFQQLINELDDYDGYYLNDDYQSLAYLYKKSSVHIIDQYEIYTSQSYWRPFPRSPLVLEIKFQNKNYFIINNHLKCCGDGSLDPYDDWDEETRRLDACDLLSNYIQENLNNDRVIVLGDLNDELTDRTVDNVFTSFTEYSDEYLFVDMEIAEGSSSGWTYPNWPSHLDHILITNELFESYTHDQSKCEVIKLDQHFYGGYNEYDQKVSDHRPVGIKIKTDPLGIFDRKASLSHLECSPNPLTHHTTFQYEASNKIRFIKIYNSDGQEVDQISLPLHSNSLSWYKTNQRSGIFYTQLIEEGLVISSGKFILLD